MKQASQVEGGMQKGEKPATNISIMHQIPGMVEKGDN